MVHSQCNVACKVTRQFYLVDDHHSPGVSAQALEWYRKAAEFNPKSAEVTMKIRNISRLLKASERNPGASNNKNNHSTTS